MGYYQKMSGVLQSGNFQTY